MMNKKVGTIATEFSVGDLVICVCGCEISGIVVGIDRTKASAWPSRQLFLEIRVLKEDSENGTHEFNEVLYYDSSADGVVENLIRTP